MIWGEYDDGLTNPSLRWTEHPYNLSMQATEILLADRKAIVGHKHENDWLTPYQMWDRQRREVLASATVLEDGDPWIESFEFIPHFVRPGKGDLPPSPKRSITKADLGYSGNWRRPYKAFCVYGGCERPRAPGRLGLCRMHYGRKAQRDGDLGPRDTLKTPLPEVCSIEGCDSPAKARGWCNAHWYRWKRHGDPLGGVTLMSREGECSVEGCSNRIRAKGLCSGHYKRQRREGVSASV